MIKAQESNDNLYQPFIDEHKLQTGREPTERWIFWLERLISYHGQINEVLADYGKGYIITRRTRIDEILDTMNKDISPGIDPNNPVHVYEPKVTILSDNIISITPDYIC